MEWGTKTSAWNVASKLQLQDNNMFSVDLKLGRFEDMGDNVPGDTLRNSRALTMASSSSSSPTSALSKRGRPRSSGAQSIVFCAVDGCAADLSQCREYHRRHRVCERHSKTPVVLICGKEQRFCQQCSRFHSLGEFDDAKRSCRKRLDGHNRRRRKTQPENFYMMNSNAFQPAHTGKGLLQFCCTAKSNWPVISGAEKALYNSQHQHLNTYSDSFLLRTSFNKGDTRVPFVPGINQQTIYHQPSSNDIASNEIRSSLKVSPDRLSESVNSRCALSLLSRYPTQSSAICMNSTMQPMAMSSSAQVCSSTAQPLNYSLSHFSCTGGLRDDSLASLSSTSTTNKAQCTGGFYGHNGLSGNRSSRIFPFYWE